MKRRNFLKLSMLGASALSANRIQGVEETIFDEKKELCANRFGPFIANLNSSQIVSVDKFEGDEKFNNMNYATPDRIQNESRVLYPCVRKSYLEKGPNSNNELRGEEEFVRVSWDKALDLAAKALKENFDKYGAESIYGECYWWGGCGKVSWGRTVVHRMLKILGGYVEESGDYSTGAGLVIMPHVFGSSTVYDDPTKWKAVIKNAKTVLFIGTDPLVTNQISSSVPTHRDYKYFTKLKDLVSSGKINAISVDTYKNNTARYINTKFIPIVPNTDTAMMIGLCHYLYTNNLYDKEFIRKYTVGFNKFKKYLLGEDDKVVKDLNWASKICKISVEELENLAKALKEPSIIIAGRALQRQDHGEQTFWMIGVLSAMLGHIGKEGLGFEFSLGYSALGGDSFLAPVVSGISVFPSKKYTKDNSPWVVGKNVTIPSSRSIEALLNPGKIIDYDGEKIKLPHMRVAYNASGSIFTRHQDVNNAVKAWKNFETVITAEPFWTSTAKLSDIVFPVAIEGERDDILESSTGEYLFALKKVIEPMGESRSDYWICKEIAKRWGVEEIFTEGKTELDWVKEIYGKASDEGKKLGYSMPSFDDFYKQGYVKFDKVDTSKEFYTRLQNFRENPNKYRLGTPSGKIEIFSPVIQKMGYQDCLGHPAWFEPFEYLGNVKKYPIAISTPHSRFRLHSQLNNSIIRNFAEINAREPVLIHPKLAEQKGIKTGDVVRVFNDRGEILCGALVSNITQEKVMVICEGAWYDPEIYGKKTLCQHGCINVLTRDKGTSSLAQSNCGHTILVDVEKFKGEIKPLRCFSKPKILQRA